MLIYNSLNCNEHNMSYIKMIEIQKKSQKGEITKDVYINEMYNYHRILFNYSEFIRDTDIKKLKYYFK